MGNRTTGTGGGVRMQVYLYNCLIISNTAPSGWGGGVDSCSGWNWGGIYNCTIAGNSSGVRLSDVYNSIVYFNTVNYDSTCSSTNCCSIPLPSGGNNITNNPMFMDTNAVNYRLIQGSPCINAGTNQGWMDGAFDLDGRSRIDHYSRIVDMGCFEYIYSGTMITVPGAGP
jgi:hypothetical protein